MYHLLTRVQTAVIDMLFDNILLNAITHTIYSIYIFTGNKNFMHFTSVIVYHCLFVHKQNCYSLITTPKSLKHF